MPGERRDTTSPAGLRAPGTPAELLEALSSVLFVSLFALTRFPFLLQLSCLPPPSPGGVYFALGLLPDYSFLLWSLRERSVKQFLLSPGLRLPCLVLGPLPLSRHRTPSRLCFLARGLRGANLRVPGSLSLLVRGQKRW